MAGKFLNTSQESILSNVELALTLSGITKKEERRKKAIAVLKNSYPRSGA